jgi:hypothetical protein
MCPQAHGHIKKTHQEQSRKPAISKAKLRFATETSLVKSAWSTLVPTQPRVVLF